MPSEWYVRVNGRIHGPVDDKKLVQLASAGKILATTEISKSQNGPWHAAASLKGLRFPLAANTDPSREVSRQQSPPASAEGASQQGSAVEVEDTAQPSRAAGIGLLISGLLCLLAGLVFSFLFTSVFGGRTRVVAYGAIGSGIGMLAAGLLNVITGKNLSDIQLLPDTSNSSVGAQIVVALAKVLITLIAIVVVGWIAFTFFLK